MILYYLIPSRPLNITLDIILKSKLFDIVSSLKTQLRGSIHYYLNNMVCDPLHLSITIINNIIITHNTQPKENKG